MNNTTDRILANMETDALTLTISNDDSIHEGTIDAIARKVWGAKKLQSLTIADCQLTSELMGDVGRSGSLADGIANHPTLMEVILPGNNFDSLAFGKNIIERDNRIHTFDVSRNKKNFSGADYSAFINTLVSTDHIIVARLTGDPWSYAEMIRHRFSHAISQDGVKAMTASIQSPRNILEWSFGDLTDQSWKEHGHYVSWLASEKEDVIGEICRRNRREAERILARVTDAMVLTTDDSVDLNPRIPAVLHLLAAQKKSYDEGISALRDFGQRVTKSNGATINLERYGFPASSALNPALT